MSDARKPPIHGRDHRPKGADPLTGEWIHWGDNTDDHDVGLTLTAPSGPFDWDGQGVTFETNANGFGVDTEDAGGFFGGFDVSCGGVNFDLHDGLDYTIDFTGGGSLIVTGSAGVQLGGGAIDTGGGAIDTGGGDIDLGGGNITNAVIDGSQITGSIDGGGA